MNLQPTPRQLGVIIGKTVEHFPLTQLTEAHEQTVFTSAGVSRARLHVEYFLLMVSAAIHEIKSAGLHTNVEQDVVLGVHDWMRQLPDEARAETLKNISASADAYAAAAVDDEREPPEPGEYSQLELEFFDRLMALGADSESRAKACFRLAAVLPKELWYALSSATRGNLRQGQLLASDA